VKPYIVGICGGSASGKTYVLQRLLATFAPDQVSLISQDNYYKSLEKQRREPDGLVNYDHPDSLDLPAFARDLHALLGGQEVSLTEYVFNNPHVVPRVFHYRPTPVIVVEGLFIFHLEELARQIDLKVFVEADEHIKLARRLRRDVAERNYTFDETLRDYERFVAPMYKQFVEPTRYTCDLVIQNNVRVDAAVTVLMDHLHQVIERQG
jgi:uridine kinase